MIELETPRDFKKKINDGIVTRDMLLNIIFAFNKRTKIYKDKELSYNEHDSYNNQEKKGFKVKML